MNRDGPLEQALHMLQRRGDEGDAGAWARLAALAGAMEADGREPDEPIREIFRLLGDRWTMLILLVLEAGEWHHATLRRIIGRLAIEGAISQRILTLKLRALERDGFVERLSTGDVPPRVSYRLSPIGRALLGEAERLMGWIRRHRDAIAASRARYDGKR